MPQYCKLYLVRHGESVANRDELTSGHLDTPLTDKGYQQAEEARTLFKNIKFDDAYSSDLQRAVETAVVIFGKPIAPDHQLSGLRERNFDKLEGQPMDSWMQLNHEFEQKYASMPFAERAGMDYADYIETDRALQERFIGALQQIAKDHLGETILVAAHAGGIRVALMHLGFASFVPPGSFKNAGYVEFLCDGTNFKIKKVLGLQKLKSAE